MGLSNILKKKWSIQLGEKSGRVSNYFILELKEGQAVQMKNMVKIRWKGGHCSMHMQTCKTLEGQGERAGKVQMWLERKA